MTTSSSWRTVAQRVRVCPVCRAAYGKDTRVCSRDGLPLVDYSPTFSGTPSSDRRPPSMPSLPLISASSPAPGGGLLPVDSEIPKGLSVGEFVVERLIAKGGMGVVYEAVHPLIGKRVAIKVLNRHYASNPKMVARFVREARSVNQIGHHNIVDIYSIGELDDGRNYLVMEYLDGMPLHHVLRIARRIAPGELLAVYEQLCDGLAAAHSKNVIHRDIKPDNIVVLRRNPLPTIKILDFGLAKLREPGTGGTNVTRTAIGTVIGTPEYMSPEQCIGDRVDARTDIYAMGVMLFELVTGRRPFKHRLPMAILEMHVRRPPPRPRKYAPVPRALERVILRAMAKRAAERQQSAAEFLHELKAAVPRALPWAIPLDTEPDASRKIIGRLTAPDALMDADAERSGRAKRRLPERSPAPRRRALGRLSPLAALAGISGIAAIGAVVALVFVIGHVRGGRGDPSSDAQLSGALVVHVNPGGATVTVDGRTISTEGGPAGVLVPVRPARTLQVAVHKAGYRREVREVSGHSEGVRHLYISLVRAGPAQ